MFFVRFLGLIVGAVLSILIAIFFVSIILFMVFYNQDWVQYKDLMTFKMIFSTLPWAIISLAIIFVVIFEVFIKKLLPLYRKPMLITLAVTVFLILIISFGINQSKGFQNLCSCNSSNFKPLERLFNKQRKNYNNLIKRGKIIDMKNKEIKIKLEDGQTVTINKNNFCENCIDGVKISDDVVLSGTNINGFFKPLKGKKDESCTSCGFKNEIKSRNNCNIR